VNEHWRTRSILAYFWSLASAIFIGYILYRWGSEKEILTLIIGLIGGTVIGGIFGVFFGGETHKPSRRTDAGLESAPETQVNTLVVTREEPPQGERD
jgi:Mn2+/Fe2+ NRAMP family transporter